MQPGVVAPRTQNQRLELISSQFFKYPIIQSALPVPPMRYVKVPTIGSFSPFRKGIVPEAFGQELAHIQTSTICGSHLSLNLPLRQPAPNGSRAFLANLPPQLR